MTVGSRNLSSQVKVAVTDEAGASFPAGSYTGMYYLKDWNGGDSAPRPYILRRIPVPAAPYYWRQGKLTKRRNKAYGDYRFILKREYTESYRRPNNWSMSVNRQVRSVHEWWTGATGTEYHSTTKLNVPTFPGHYTLVDSNRINKLVADLGNRIRGHEFEAAVSFSQLPLALRMIGESATRIAMSIAHVRRGNFSRALQIIGAPPAKRNIGDGIAARILEVQYGWRPLINDAYHGAEALAAMMHHDRKVVYKISSHKRSTVPERGLLGLTFQERTASHLYAITAYVKENLGQQTLDLWDPAKVAWELTPYSFVVDWFFPISKYLEARGAASRLKGEFVISQVSRRLCKGVAKDTGGTYGVKRYNAGLQSIWEELRVLRNTTTSLSSLPKMPVFRGWRKSLTWQHALNGLALIAVAPVAHPISILRRGGRVLKDAGYNRMPTV